MTSYYITFATESYSAFQKEHEKFAESEGFDVICSYTPDSIHMFWKYYEHILNPIKNGGHPSGGCAWKPYIIWQTLITELKKGDWLVYVDCGDSCSAGFKSFIEKELTSKSFMFVGTMHSHRQYTNIECFEKMGCNYAEYLSSTQCEAGIIALRWDFNVSFILEWLRWCLEIDVLFPTWPDYDCIAHRGDQSILQNLLIKHGVETTPVFKLLPYVDYNHYDSNK